MTEDQQFYTPKECAILMRYETRNGPEIFLRAFRRAGYRTVGPAGKVLIQAHNLQDFIHDVERLCTTIDNN